MPRVGKGRACYGSGGHAHCQRSRNGGRPASQNWHDCS
ncbi:hypothetical protein ARTSIC4J27_4508 [Pseudarthrobacter siccitolerans]|uniref:Uncharacterized protein n=1 Tax=Pseudarthrobacter siccitolerans TaxID=861266 RepID=A0A024H930_9MICC|nr:hypothetical protein ARTSIC4J27_4508 [Pseudarthrobacter siccitolerans]